MNMLVSIAELNDNDIISQNIFGLYNKCNFVKKFLLSFCGRFVLCSPGLCTVENKCCIEYQQYTHS